MSKLREDYQFVYDTLSLRASMLVTPLAPSGSGAGMEGSNSTQGSAGSRGSGASLGSGGSGGSAKNSGDSVMDPHPTGGSTDSIVSDMATVKQAAVSGTEALVSAVPATIPVTPAATSDSSEEEDVMALLRSLESRRKIQETDVLARMVARCETMMEAKETVAQRKGDLVGSVFSSMKAIASVQTDIQFKLKKGGHWHLL